MSEPGSSTSALLAALPALEASLGKLKSKPWSETTESLESLDRAKMDVLLSYAVNDLIWVYLKLKGVDPASHEVTAELYRIKKYYTKIKMVEEPETRRSQVDKAAAHRFITAAIPRSQRTPQHDLPSTSAAAQAAADATRAVGSEGDVSLSGRFRFVAKEGEKVRRTAEDAFGGDRVEVDGEEEEEDGGDDGMEVDDFEALQRAFDETVENAEQGEDADMARNDENDAEAKEEEIRQQEKEQLEFAERHRKKKQKRAEKKKKAKA